MGAVRIGWSFFAGALGAWVISGPPSYTASGYGYGAGAIGLVFYSLSSGLPVIMVAFAGELIRVSSSRLPPLPGCPGGWLPRCLPASLPPRARGAADAGVRPRPSRRRCAAQGAARAVAHRLHGLALWVRGQVVRGAALHVQHGHR